MKEFNKLEKKQASQKGQLCRYCQQPLNEKAKVCHHCERDQRPLLQYFASSTAFVMVLIAIVQAIMGYIQYKESKIKRIEAAEVLAKAQHVFMIASTNSNEMKIRASEVLAVAKSESNNALVKSSSVLRIAETNAMLAKDVTKKAGDEVKHTVGTLKQQLDESNKNLILLKNRNYLTALADKAISRGDRKSYEQLSKMVGETKDGDKSVDATSELLRVKSHYLTGTRIPFNTTELAKKSGEKVKIENISTEELIEIATYSPNWPIRGVAIWELRKRKEKHVPAALIHCMENDDELDVLAATIDSFQALTGYVRKDVLNTRHVTLWWEENKERVLKDFK